MIQNKVIVKPHLYTIHQKRWYYGIHSTTVFKMHRLNKKQTGVPIIFAMTYGPSINMHHYFYLQQVSFTQQRIERFGQAEFHDTMAIKK
jgi:hypothetical protein